MERHSGNGGKPPEVVEAQRRPGERGDGGPRRLCLLTTASSGRLVQGMQSARKRDATDATHRASVDEPALVVERRPDAVFERLSRRDVDAFLVEVSADAANGVAWIESARATHPALPIVAVLERADEEDCSRALAAGADACLSLEALAPCALRRAVALAMERRELRSCVDRARRQAGDGSRLRFGSFEVDAANLVLRKRGRPVPIHRTPLRLLIHLARNRGRTVPKEELLESVWAGVVVSDWALASALKELRHALGDDGVRQHVIETRRGIGYRFVGESSGAEAAGPEA